MKKFYIIALSSLISLGSFAENESIEFKKAFSEATALIFQGNYPKALTKLLDLNKMDPNNANLEFQIGYCYLQPPANSKKAIEYLEKASNNISKEYKEGYYKETKAPLEVFKHLGDAYHLNYQFEAAIATYNRFIIQINPNAAEQIDQIRKQIQVCKDAMEIKKFPLNMLVTNLGQTLNSKYADYNPCLTVDESVLVFTSKRESSTGGLFEENGQYFEDIYISNKLNGEWTTPKSIGPSINTEGHESALNISADGQTLLIYKYDYEGQGDIYLSRLNGLEWSIPQKMGSDINTASWDGNATISADGQYLYFSSSRPGGFGGKDIYFCKKLPTGDWALAQNCGANINTDGDEDAAFIHPDGTTLFFSSNGLKTMGGYDIFFAEKIEEKKWTTPQNMGYPVNTPSNDIYFKPTADRKRAFYSSFRTDGFGDYDLYAITFPEIKTQPLTVFKGFVTDETGKVPADLVINVSEVNNKAIIGTYLPNSATGKYIIILNPGRVYNIEYETAEGVVYSEKFDVPEGSSYQEIDRAINLPPLKIKKVSDY